MTSDLVEQTWGGEIYLEGYVEDFEEQELLFQLGTSSWIYNIFIWEYYCPKVISVGGGMKFFLE